MSLQLQLKSIRTGERFLFLSYIFVDCIKSPQLSWVGQQQGWRGPTWRLELSWRMAVRFHSQGGSRQTITISWLAGGG